MQGASPRHPSCVSEFRSEMPAALESSPPAPRGERPARYEETTPFTAGELIQLAAEPRTVPVVPLEGRASKRRFGGPVLVGEFYELLVASCSRRCHSRAG